MKMANNDDKVIIRCNQCQERFSRLEWMTNKNCDNPNCSCPEVKKVAAQATQAINNAKSRAGFQMAKIVVPLPTQMKADVEQYYIDVEPMVVYEIHKNRSKRK
jgi:hypothetical protein